MPELVPDMRKLINEMLEQTINISYPHYLFPLNKQSYIVETFKAKLRLGDYDPETGEVDAFLEVL